MRSENHRNALDVSAPGIAAATSAFASSPAVRRARTPGTRGLGESLEYVWPLWSAPLSLHGIEALLSHPDVIAGDLGAVRPLGVLEIMAARRFATGKFMNVAWARPASIERGRDRVTASRAGG